MSLDGLCLIVGAGPVGLTLASLLAKYEVPYLIVDKNPAPVIQTKAAGLWSRTLEVFDHLGLAEECLARSHRCSALHFFADNQERIHLDLSKIASRFNFLTMLPQDRTEQLLIEALEQRGGSVERGWALESHDAGVARLRNEEGEIRQVQFQYLLGCDGAHSTVRKSMGLNFSGFREEGLWLVGDLAARGDCLPADDVSLFVSPKGPFAFFALGQGRYRVACSAHSGMEKGQEVTLEHFQQAAEQRLPSQVHFSDPKNMSAWEIHERQVDTYRSGNTFLLGDAAHIHSPAGGQGLNTGVQDAFNLAWKLAQVIRWGAADSLLDTYHSERHAVAARVLKGSSVATHMISLKNPLARGVRDLALTLAGRLEMVQNKIRTVLSETDIHYRESVLSEHGEDWHLPAGDRVPDVSWQENSGDERHLHHLFRHAGWTLLEFSSECFLPKGRLKALQEAALLKVFTFDLSSSEDHPVAQTLGAEPGSAFLIRPDGYLSASFSEYREAMVLGHLAEKVGFSLDRMARPAKS